MEVKIRRDRRSERVIDMDHLLTDVKGDERDAARRHHPPRLHEDRTKLDRLGMHDGIKQHRSSERGVGHVEAPHVFDPELELRVETSRDVDHLAGDVDTKDRHTRV